jgi:pimeloyl-ACP methyl ester carboxylesterase
VDIMQYGQSDKCRISGPMWDFHAAKTIALMDTLGVGRADFVCNSWGGTIALCLAARYPDPVRSLVVTGSMPVFYGPLAPLPEGGRRGRNARDVYYGGEGPTREKMRDLITRLEWHDGARLPEETVDLRWRQSLDPGERELAAMSDSLRGDRQDLTAELGRIEAPVLFVWGREDAFLTPDYPLMLSRMRPRRPAARRPLDHRADVPGADREVHRRAHRGQPQTRGHRPDQLGGSAGSGAIDEFLGVAIERPALEQLEVEVARAPENRAGPGPSRDDGEDGHLEAVDQAGGHQGPVQRQAGR